MSFLPARLSFGMFSIFLVMGIYVPYLPVWLEGKGMSAEQIGLILAVALWARVPTSIPLAALTEHRGNRKTILIYIAIIIAIGFMIFPYLDGYIPILLGWLVVGTLLTSMVPLVDSMIMYGMNNHGVDYGRTRLWGSISFIAASVVGGWYLQGRGSSAVETLFILTSLVIVVAMVVLPNLRTKPRAAKSFAVTELLRNSQFVWFFVTASFLQASHAGLYGFATLTWLGAGISESVVGLLWAEGVVVEILLFTFGKKLMTHFRVWQVFLLASLAGIIRWTIIGTTADLGWLIAVQALHALTFAATHLAAMTYISRNIPEDQAATAASIYDGMAMGFIFGFAMLLAGWVYAAQGGDAFYLMSILSLFGGIGAIVLKFKRHSF